MVVNTHIAILKKLVIIDVDNHQYSQNTLCVSVITMFQASGL